jgi:UDP-N-acetylglucosamine--N-acetylmuramyl-(pentapeptide) pyrophosphoryl-undecaprenol N-acetylglucosamine transferase
MIAAGGTGGHFYPGLAVLDALRERSDVLPMFVGTPRGIEARVVPGLGYPITLLDISPLNGVRGTRLVGALAKLPRAGFAAFRAMRQFRPDVVLSVGGYAAGPISAAAIASRVPLCVVEPNAIPGMTHRLVGRFVARAFVTYDETSGYFRKGATRVVGTPVRKSFLERASRVESTRAEVPHVMVVGGSQGARAINQVVPGAVAEAQRAGLRVTITHQTGNADRESVAKAYADRGLDAEVTPFIDDMASAMARADLLVCRSGAGAVAELGVIGKPAVFVPLPTAADDHQRKNAEAVAARGAGVCLVQRDLSEQSLAAQLTRLLRDRSALDAMASRARELGRPRAADDVADEIMAVAR